MKVTTLRIPESLYETLEEEADAQDLSFSEYARRILRNRKEHTPEYEEGYASIGRVDELEERIAALEEPHEEPVTAEERQPATEAVSEPAEPTDGHTDSETPHMSVDAGEWHGLLDDPDVYSHKNPDSRRAQMLAAGSAALEFLRTAEEPVATGEFLELYERHPVDGQSPPGNAERPSKETYWRKTLKPALDAAADAGFAKQRSGSWDWVWVDENSESGVYDPTTEF